MVETDIQSHICISVNAEKQKGQMNRWKWIIKRLESAKISFIACNRKQSTELLY